MVYALAGESKASANVIRFQIRHFLKNRCLREAGVEKVEHIRNANAHASNAGAAATLQRVDGDAFKNAHSQSMVVGFLAVNRNRCRSSIR